MQEQYVAHWLLCQVGVCTKDSRAVKELVIALWISACPWFTFVVDCNAKKGVGASDAYSLHMENLPMLQAKKHKHKQYCRLHSSQSLYKFFGRAGGG